MTDAVGMMDILGQSQSFGADSALVPGMTFITFYFDQFAVLNFELEAAAAVGTAAGRPGCSFDYFSCLFPCVSKLLVTKLRLLLIFRAQIRPE